MENTEPNGQKLKELAEEDLSDVAGGGRSGGGSSSGGNNPPGSWYVKAMADGRRFSVPVPCPKCGAAAGGEYSMYAKIEDPDMSAPAMYYVDVKCYACEFVYIHVDSNGGYGYSY